MKRGNSQGFKKILTKRKGSHRWSKIHAIKSKCVQKLDIR